jgi:hypothetical protein
MMMPPAAVNDFLRRTMFVVAALWLAACAPAAPQTTVVTRIVSAPASETATLAPAAAESTHAPEPTLTPPPTATAAGAVVDTQAPAPTLLPTQGAIEAQPTPISEARVVELEWPQRIRLGDSESVRLALIPSTEGYTVTTEFPDNTTITQTVNVPRPSGYDLFGVAQLSGVEFEIAPVEAQVHALPPGEPVTWRWTLTPKTAGQHRLNVNLFLRWVPTGATGAARETQLYSRSVSVQVTSFLGLTGMQAMLVGVFGLMIGGALSATALVYGARPVRRLAAPTPARNPALVIEPPPALSLSDTERGLLQTLFRRYARIVIENEFRSGYSGARALLVLPVRSDGRADAHTIVKIGEARSIQKEFENYETFVKDTLPPITARIQDAPVTLPLPAAPGRARGGLGAIRYTFIAEPGQRPISLGEALRVNPEPALLSKLFETFGPNWWMQRRAHTFRLAQEYDRLLPAHYVLMPADDSSRVQSEIGPRTSPAEAQWSVNEVVRMGRFSSIEARQDGQSLSLTGEPAPGQPPLRVRWMSLTPPAGTNARVVATRETLLRESAAGLDPLGLPDPIARLPALLNENVIGSQSTIHGDLNLENVLAGPGGFVWLIDFAQTRDGHPLLDFAHLEAEIIAHVIAVQVDSPQHYLEMWRAQQLPLLDALHQIAARCLVNASQPREQHLALYAACLGALKYPNLGPHSKHLLYLTAAELASGL